MRAANPSADYKELARQIGDRWKNLSEEDKRVRIPLWPVFHVVVSYRLILFAVLIVSHGLKQES